MVSSYLKLLFVLTSVLAVGCASETHDGPLARVGESRAGASGSDTPRTPAEFRRLRAKKLPEVSTRFLSLRDNPGDVALRQELEDLYREAGYSSVANFFQASRDPIFNRIVDYPTAYSSVAWVEPVRSEPGYRAESEAIGEVCSLVLDNEFQEAVDLAAVLMVEGPYALQEVATWSYAALWYIVADAGPIEDTAPEVVFRVFLTSLDDATRPQCVADRVGGFQLISALFAKWGDPVSAYTAAAIQHELYFEWPTEKKSDAYTKLVRTNIRKLQQAIKPYNVEDD